MHTHNFALYIALIRAIAFTGQRTVAGINGKLEGAWVRTLGDFTYRTALRSQATEVCSDQNRDPFLSCTEDGQSCRVHLHRYNFPKKIWEHLRIVQEEATGLRSQTLILLKPDAIQRELTDKIIQILRQNGFEIQRTINHEKTKTQAEAHLAELRERLGQNVYERNLRFYESGPMVALVVTAPGSPIEVIEKARMLQGPTDPKNAAPGTIRNLSRDTLEKAIAENRGLQNLCHTSDSIESLERELKIWAPS